MINRNNKKQAHHRIIPVVRLIYTIVPIGLKVFAEALFQKGWKNPPQIQKSQRIADGAHHGTDVDVLGAFGQAGTALDAMLGAGGGGGVLIFLF